MSHASSRLHSLLAPVLVCAGALSVLFGGTARGFTDASQVDTTLLFNQKFFGLISNALDEDVVEIEDVAGSKITAIVTRDGANGLKPDVDILDSNFAVLDTSAVKTKGADQATIKNFVLPAGGTYFVRVRSINGFTGTFKLSVTGKPPKKPVIPPGTISVVGEVDTLTFPARGNSKLSGTIVRTGGDLEPLVIELVSPTGTLVPIDADKHLKLNAAGDTLTITNIGLPSIGDYQLRITGQGGTTGGYVANLKVVPPKPVSGSLFEDEHPTPVDDTSPTITLKEIYFGRGLRSETGDTMKVVSPFTVVKTDPVSDLAVPGTLDSIFPGIDPAKPIPMNLDSFFAPMIVPRNAVIVLKFNREPGKASLKLTDENVMTSDSPIQISLNGNLVMFEVFVNGKNLILNPVYGDNVGMPGSPIVVDANGNPVAASDGAAKLSILSGVNGLTGVDGGLYKPRPDLLASPDAGGTAVGFNPGNQVLDFFKQSTVGGAVKSYTGFLPDEAAPRIVREKKEVGNYTPNFLNPALGDIQGTDTFSVVLTKALDVTQNNGKGEYAGGVVRLRPNGPKREQHVIISHTVTNLGGGLFRNEFLLASNIKIPLKAPNGVDPGEQYQIVRAEYYEPDPEHPIDPALFDPNDPDLGENIKIENFVEVLDRDGNIEDILDPIDPKSTLTVRFTEPMLLETFRPYESFFVTDFPATTSYGFNYVGRVVSSEGGKAMTFQPYREIQFGAQAGTAEVLGFGPNPIPLQVHLISVPSSAVLISLLGEQGYADFVRAGQRGATDLGGQAIAFPPGFIGPTNPFVDFAVSFTTKPDATIPATGAVVHRFLGQPLTGSDENGDTGVSFPDMPESICGPGGNLYGPRIADINLFTNGFLSGAPVAFFQKIHDDFNPPPTGSLIAFPFGTSTPIGGFSVQGGAKLQHVYRALDCSPDYEALSGTILDLTRVDFAPISGLIANTILPDVSIHAGHSAVIPDTDQGQGIPGFPNSGLSPQVAAPHAFGGHFQTLGNPNTTLIDGSYNATLAADGTKLKRQSVLGSLQPGAVADFYTGKQVPLDSKNLYTPAGSGRVYHPLPPAGFDNPFPYNNGAFDTQTFTSGVTWGTPFKPKFQSMVLEYRVRVHTTATPPSTQNAFTFAVGILSSALPRFRIFTFGAGCTACCAANCANTCAVSIGPSLNGSLTGGGNPLDPDRIVNAAGPNVSAPGLTCACVGPPQNKIPCAAGLTDQTVTNPNLEQVAYGQSTNPGSNNFGDNSRYYMVFNYVKRESIIRSPFAQVQPADTVVDPIYLEPIFSPPLTQLPAGTTFDIKFRASTNGLGQFDSTPYVTPDQVPLQLNGGSRQFIQFQVRIEGNTSSQLVPVFDEIVIPFRKNN